MLEVFHTIATQQHETALSVFIGKAPCSTVDLTAWVLESKILAFMTESLTICAACLMPSLSTLEAPSLGWEAHKDGDLVVHMNVDQYVIRFAIFELLSQ